LFIEASAALAEKDSMLVLAGMSAIRCASANPAKMLNSLLLITSPIDGVVLEKSPVPDSGWIAQHHFSMSPDYNRWVWRFRLRWQACKV